MRVLLIGDTHGLLRPAVAALLAEVDAVLHAGDVGTPATWATLRAAHPRVHAVRGNVDRDPGLQELPLSEDLVLEGLRIHLLHRLQDLDPDAAARADVVVFGHSHRPERFSRDGTDFVNPGSIGPRRFRLPISYAELHIDGDGYRIDLHELREEAR